MWKYRYEKERSVHVQLCYFEGQVVDLTSAQCVYPGKAFNLYAAIV